MTLHTINTGFFKLDGGAMFGVVPKAIWQKTNPADSNNLCTWAMRCLLVEDGNKLMLIDTGIGNKQDAKFFGHYYLHGDDTMDKSLAAIGFQRSDITDVFLTHLHFDHCGGAIERVGDKLLPAFKNAIYWSNKQHWQWATEPNDREKASFLKDNILPIQESGQLQFVNSELSMVNSELSMVNSESSMVNSELSIVNSELSMVNSELSIVNSELSIVNSESSIVNSELSMVNEKRRAESTSHIIHPTSHIKNPTSYIVANGHTESMMLPMIQYKGRTIVYVADLLPSIGHLPLPYVMAYDTRPLITLKEKKSFLQEAADNDYILYFEHDPVNECCTLEQTEKGIRVAETFALSVL